MSNDLELELKRAKRRAQAKKKLLVRLDKWSYIIADDGETYAQVKEAVLLGVRATFLRTTSKPCSCSICKREKYKRETPGARRHVLHKVYVN